MTKTFVALASLFSFIGVALGAFAAHALKDKLPPDLFAVWEVGVRYHMYHALGLFAVAWVGSQFPNANVIASGWLFVGGIIIFSGSLYALSLSGMHWLGAITPVGGLCFLAGWLWLGRSVWRSV